MTLSPDTAALKPNSASVKLDTAVLKFPFAFDPVLLRRDLAACEQVARWVPQDDYGKLNDEGWNVMPLRVRGGRVDNGSGGTTGLEPFQDTELMRVAPYFRSIFESLGCRHFRTIRLSRLEAGGKISLHVDRGEFHDKAKEMGLVLKRLHIPIQTNEDIDFRLDGVRRVWGEGEVWYADFARLHSVANNSPKERVHLLIDVVLDPKFCSVLPEGHWFREHMPVRPAHVSLDPALIGSSWSVPAPVMELLVGAMERLPKGVREIKEDIRSRLISQLVSIFGDMRLELHGDEPMVVTKDINFLTVLQADNTLVWADHDFRLEFKKDGNDWQGAIALFIPHEFRAPLRVGNELMRIPLVRKS